MRFVTEKRYRCSIVWLRRDLRLRDNVALNEAARASERVVLAFNLDPRLLRSERIGAPIVQTFFDALAALRDDLRERGSDLALLEGDFAQNLIRLAKHTHAQAVFYNRDYEPSAIERDVAVTAQFQGAGLSVHDSLDHVVFEASDIRTDAGEPYKVYTPYARRWRERYARAPQRPADSLSALHGVLLPAGSIGPTRSVPSPEEFGYQPLANVGRCNEKAALRALERFLDGPAERYARDRDFPAIAGTSKLSIHLRAGTIGIRHCVARAYEAASQAGGASEQIGTWINELIWREFYQMILREFPKVDGAPFIDAAAGLAWNEDEDAFGAWCDGRTGYPIVDAAMRQLNTTGWMHNRLRMIVASFLTKDLLIDWQRGERYFEQHLADADLAQNNGGWQWAASTGTDAAPYFRIFNPVTQSERFDPSGAFIRAMVPELAHVADEHIHAPWKAGPLGLGDYPPPIVDHKIAREKALALYGPVLGRTPATGARALLRRSRA
jgi:deoxyribodipyrimidine photo-lyase